MNRMLLALGAVSTVLIAGCTSTQITKVTQVESEEICIVDNPGERPAFRDAYERTIQAKGYKTRVVSDAKDCRVSTTYSSSMGWSGWGPYLSDADLQVFSGDKLVGRATYHAKKVPTSNGRLRTGRSDAAFTYNKRQTSAVIAKALHPNSIRSIEQSNNRGQTTVPVTLQ